MSIEAMKQALEALESATPKYTRQRADQKTLGGALDYWKLEQHQRLKAITSLRQAIAEAEKQEPEKYALDIECERCGAKQSGVLTVHTHPQPKREPLTDEQIAEISVECATVTPSDIYFARAIEAAHGIKE